MQYARITIQTMIFVLAAAISCAAQTAQAPEQPDAMDLLKSVELAYGAMNTYSAKVTTTMAMDGSDAQGKINMEASMTVTADSTGRFRLESKGMMGMTLVFDGSTMWMYIPTGNSYSKVPLHSGAEAGGGMFGLGANGLQEYKDVTSGVKEAKILRSEKLHVNDSDVDCWVVSLEYDSVPSEASAAAQAAGVSIGDFAQVKTLWVDKSRYLVYQVDATSKMTMPNASTPTNMKETSKVESVTVNGPISPDTFTFTPPPGAKEMEHSESFKMKSSQKQLEQQ